MVEGVAETIAFTEGLDLDPALLIEAIGGGPLDLPYFQTKDKAITKRNFDPHFTLKLAAKDSSLMEDAARQHELDLPLLTTIGRRLQEGAAKHPAEDVSATY